MCEVENESLLTGLKSNSNQYTNITGVDPGQPEIATSTQPVPDCARLSLALKSIAMAHVGSDSSFRSASSRTDALTVSTERQPRGNGANV